MKLLIDRDEFPTYGVYLTPHLEKYQEYNDSDYMSKIADIAKETWNFGNHLKGQKKHVRYMHGPVGYYEGTFIEAFTLEFKKEIPFSSLESSHVKEFLEDPFNSDDEYLYFLFQKLPGKLKYTKLQTKYIDEMRKQRVNGGPKRTNP